MLLLKLKKFVAVICIFTLAAGVPTFGTSAADGDALDAINLICEEKLTNEVSYAITKNLDLDLSDILPNGIDVSFKSNSDALVVDGKVAYVVRNLYHDIPVKLTATVKSETQTLEKVLNFTLLRQTANVHLSENFYYPNNKGKLFTDEPALTGWVFRYKTLLTGESTDTERFKAITDEINGNYVLKGYRDCVNNGDYNYLVHEFSEKPSGIVSVKADVTFDHQAGTQNYVFRAGGNYNDNGSIVNKVIFELNFKYNENGKSALEYPCYEGNERKGKSLSIDYMPQVGAEAQIEWRIDTDNQEWYLYIDGNKVNEEAIPFLEKNMEGANRTDFSEITYIDFNIYRNYTGGIVYIDDLVVTSENKKDTSRFNVTEEMLTNEPCNIITKNLDLLLEDELKEGITVSFESDNAAINAKTGEVVRDLYYDKNVTLTATVTDGVDTWKNKLYFTVLRQTTEVYMSENFYYHGEENKILYDVKGIKRSEINATAAMEGRYGWSTRYLTDMSDDTSDGQRFKSYIDTEDDSYILHSYRPVSMANEYNSTYYILPQKPDGEVVQSVRVKFEHETLPQQYIFRTYGIFIVNGAKERTAISETTFKYDADGAFSIVVQRHDGNDIKSESYNTVTINKGEWANIEWHYHPKSLTMDIYVDNTLVNPEPIAFRDALDETLDRTNYFGMNDFEFNTYRNYAQGHLYIDNISITSSPEWYNKNPELAYLYNELSEDDFTAEDKNAISKDLDFENNSMAHYIQDNEITVKYSSDNKNVISDKGFVVRGKEDTEVNVTVTMSKNGASIQKKLSFTVLCSEEYMDISNALKKITEECFTDESVKHITKSFDLDYTVPADVEVTFTSNAPSVMDVQTQKNKCIVSRPLSDTDVALNVTATQNGKSLSKKLYYRVLAKDKSVSYSDSFYYPQSLGENITGVNNNWRESDKADYYYTNSIAKEDLNYYLHTQRTGTSGHQNYIVHNLSNVSPYKLTYEMDVRFNHTCVPQYYFFKIYGKYIKSDGSVENTTLVDINFYDDISKKYMFTRTDAGSVTLSESLIINEWFTLKIEVNTAEKTADYFINGIKLSDNPVELYEYAKWQDYTLYAVDDLRITAYRNHAGEIDIDNFAAYTQSGDALLNTTFYSGGKRISSLEEALNKKIDLDVRLYNQTDTAKSVSVALCEFQGNTLKNIRLQGITLDNDPKTIEKLQFKDFLLSENLENSFVRVYLLDTERINPYQNQQNLENILNRKVIAGQMTCETSGRTYNWVDFNGENMIRSYFTMQGWSPDGKKFYVRDDDFKIYEYDITSSTVKYIDTGKFEHTMMVTKKGGLFYINRDNEIIRMDVNTYERQKIADIPSEYADNAGMLQVMDNEKKLSVEWSDKKLKEEGYSGSRFPVYDLETKQWDYSHKWVFPTQQYSPNHVSINPVKENLLMFCHEGTTVNDRLWVVDMDTDSYYNVFVPKFYTSNTAGEIACHEMWTYDGEEIVFQASSLSSNVSSGGIISIRYDGKERSYINSDYSYNHVATSPVDKRWAVADTSASRKNTSDVVLIDCYTGKSYLIARVSQTEVNPGHCHPAFNQDGTKVWFGHYDESGRIIRIGWADVSDIINNAPEGGWYNLSESCESFSYKETETEVETVNFNGKTLYSLDKDKVMRINVKTETAYLEKGNAQVSITYLDEGTDTFSFTYYTFEKGTYNRLVKHTETITKTGTNVLKTITLELFGICLDNMEKLKTDFTITTPSNVKIQSVETKIIGE